MAKKEMKNTAKKILFLIFVVVTFNLSAQTVYTTKTGEKYHKSNCRYLKYSKKELPLERALAYGYLACSVCKPPKKTKTSIKSNSKSSITTSHNSHSTSSKSVATQCTGKTKSGSRCKRKTKNANGRCYQH